MKLNMFAIYDDKAKAYLMPFFMPEVGMAVRAFRGTVNDSDTNICKYPADFTLFHFGKWDDSNGTFDLVAVPVALANGLHVKEVDAMPEKPRNVELFPNGSIAPNGQGV